MSNFDDSICNLSSEDDDESYPEYKYSDDFEGVYHENFPQEWAENHDPNTGPYECANCAFYGCVGDVFVGYCANCAMYVYKGSRGRGFVGDGLENTSDDAMQYPSAFDTYLEGVEFEPNDPMELDNTETSVLNCHFEGGYADF